MAVVTHALAAHWNSSKMSKMLIEQQLFSFKSPSICTNFAFHSRCRKPSEMYFDNSRIYCNNDMKVYTYKTYSQEVTRYILYIQEIAQLLAGITNRISDVKSVCIEIIFKFDVSTVVCVCSVCVCIFKSIDRLVVKSQ